MGVREAERNAGTSLSNSSLATWIYREGRGFAKATQPTTCWFGKMTQFFKNLCFLI